MALSALAWGDERLSVPKPTAEAAHPEQILQAAQLTGGRAEN